MLDRIELILQHVKANEATRDAMIATPPSVNASAGGPANLMMFRGVGPDFAEILWSEGLYRRFDNRRQLAAYAGLAPTPWQSGNVSREQGVSQAGNPRLRTIMVQLSWFWLLHQPDSALTRSFRERTKAGGRSSGSRKRRALLLFLAVFFDFWRRPKKAQSADW